MPCRFVRFLAHLSSGRIASLSPFFCSDVPLLAPRPAPPCTPQATVARKLKDSEMQTQWTLIYQLSSKLRMQLNSVSSAATRLLFEFSA